MFDKDYRFRGKHAEMVNRLTSPLGDISGGKIFDTNLDVYLVAPLVGFLYNRKAPVDKEVDQEAKIFRDKMLDGKETSLYNFRLIMLQTYKNLEPEERVKKVFKNDNNDEDRKPDDELYDSYVRGGVEVLYEHIFEDANGVDEYIMNLYEFIEDFHNRYSENGISENDIFTVL